jgi:hypothetical protein
VLVLELVPPNTATVPSPQQKSTLPERYEPLPGLPQLPGWLWRKMGRRARLAAAAAVVASIAIAAVVLPGILESRREGAAADARERAQLRAERIRELEAEQRPRFRRSESVAPAGAGAEARLAARAGLMDELSRTVLADSRRRVRRGELDGPIHRVVCEPFPRTVEGVGADSDLSRRAGRYSCVAVTATFGRSESSVGGVIGHQYRVLVDFHTGRYAYCKVSGQAGPSREQLVTTPRACGGVGVQSLS